MSFMKLIESKLTTEGDHSLASSLMIFIDLFHDFVMMMLLQYYICSDICSRFKYSRKH